MRRTVAVPGNGQRWNQATRKPFQNDEVINPKYRANIPRREETSMGRMGKIGIGFVFRFTKDGLKNTPASARQRALCWLWEDFFDEYRAEIEWGETPPDRPLPPEYCDHVRRLCR